MVRARVINEGAEGGGEGGCQRSAGPPHVELGGQTDADILFVGRRFGDVGQGEVVFGEAFVHRFPLVILACGRHLEEHSYKVNSVYRSFSPRCSRSIRCR
jgi:hypothetical protein